MTKLFGLMLLILSPVNSYLIRRHGSHAIRHCPIFIIGAPRTGSTVLYQAITNQGDVLYIDNLVCRFNKVIFIGFWLSSKLFGNRPHNCFNSVHGGTSGFHAPSECGGFWYRWLPMERHFIDFDEVTQANIARMRQEITAVSNYFDKPIVFKNLNAGQRMRLISQIFPNAKFIYITRDYLHTAQSILNAKRELGIPDNQYWSVMPSNIDELRSLPWPQQIAQQIYSLESQIEKDSSLFPAKNTVKIEYSCLNEKTIYDLIERLSLATKLDYMDAEISRPESTKIVPSEEKALRAAIATLDWSTKSDK